jgi:RND family efflux transporter MFP subunit
MSTPRIFRDTLRGAAALLLGSAAIAWFAWPAARPADAAATAPTPPPAAVSVAPAVRDAIAPTTWVTGSVESRDDARIASELAGRVLWVAEIGARVARGEPLARLDEAPLRLQGAHDEAALARIEARLALAQRQVERLDSLDGRSAVAQTQLDQVRSERDVLAAERAQAAAVLAESRRRVQAAVVRAPFAGIVVERVVRPGEFVQVGAPVARFVDTGNLEVRAAAPLALVDRLVPGIPVIVRAAGVERAATLRAMVPVGDASSRQVELRVALVEAGWMAGSAVEVALPAADAREALLVPRDALVLRGAESFVFRVGDDARAQRLAVRTGPARGDAVVVEGGLEPGDRLVVRGAERLSDGQAVTVVAGS